MIYRIDEDATVIAEVFANLLVKALIAMGTTDKEIAGAIAKRTPRAA